MIFFLYEIHVLLDPVKIWVHSGVDIGDALSTGYTKWNDTDLDTVSDECAARISLSTNTKIIAIIFLLRNIVFYPFEIFFHFYRVLNFLLNIFLNVLLNFLLYFIFVFSKLCLLFFKNDITKSFRLSSYPASAFACFGERANLFLGDWKFFLASLVAEKLQIDMLKSIRQWTTVLQNK